MRGGGGGGGGGIHLKLSFHLPHFGLTKKAMPPKGCMTVRVGGEGEEPQRFVVPLMYLSHPLFAGLLKAAEDEYGFEQKGVITIPCHVDHFRLVQGFIDDETGRGRSGNHSVLAWCFRQKT